MYKKITIGICDDDNAVHELMSELVDKYGADRNLSIDFIHFVSAKEVLENTSHMDCLLLDIDMPGMDGIDLGYELRKLEVSYKIIMLSGRTDRFKDAFKIEAFRFISKPVECEELYAALDDLIIRSGPGKSVEVYKSGIKQLIEADNITYIEGNGSETCVYTAKTDYRSENSLSGWMELLDPVRFCQCHRSYIVNFNRIKDIADNAVIMSTGERIPVSRRLKKDFTRKYMIFDTKWR
ncbi:LytR/AlgR family response regulator transcription factor [Butyrivibrio sp. MC2013]|uniref:LytR/AlgR family response regulator transcription factor n=1 Tax=Butyrivibrio sp. MC2013 TaxID=1280686 RepID=UPI0003F7728F|nr:LytTR family DNA-binding domain-containing protein [Butyrivibrio sp. MC2013]